MEIIKREELCGITVITVAVRKYIVRIFTDERGFINADISMPGLHEIVYSEDGIEAMFPGIMELVA